MKATLLQDGPERTCALVFDAGEDVVAALRRFASDEKLRGAHLTATGTFQRVTLGFFDPTRKEYKPVSILEPVEALSLVANIGRDDEGAAKRSSPTRSR